MIRKMRWKRLCRKSFCVVCQGRVSSKRQFLWWYGTVDILWTWSFFGGSGFFSGNSGPSFDLTFYFPVLEKEVKAFGLNVTITEKEKTIESNIRSAFLKGNTKEHLLLFYADEQAAGSVARSEAVKIKFEVDVNPPAYATFEHKYRLLPSPYEVNMYDMPSLFSGKIHAVLCRAWQSRIKGGIFMTMFFIFPKGLQLTRSISGNDCFSLDSLHQMKNVPCQSLSKCFMTDLTLLILSRQNRM